MKNFTMRARKSFWAAASILAILLPVFASAATLPRPNLQTPSTACISGVPQVTISWSKPSGALYYTILRAKLNSSTWTAVYVKTTSALVVDKTTSTGTTYQYKIKAYFSTGVSYSNILTVTVPSCAVTSSPTPTTPPSTPTPPPPPTLPSSEIKFDAYLTGYGWPDNTPASANISDGVIHTSAGGVGTYADPITLAVGHSIISGNDILDYPKGTKFYIPTLRKYFIVEDTCGDGNAPQNGPCHSGYQGKVWLDAWVGGQNATASSVYACEDKITGVHSVIQNPASNYAVVSGPVFNGTCATLFGNTPVTI